MGLRGDALGGDGPALLRLCPVRRGALQPDVGCSQDCGISAEIIPALMRSIPSPPLQPFPLRSQAWGNPCLTPWPAEVRNGLSPPAGPWAELSQPAPCPCPPWKGREDRLCNYLQRRPRSGPARARPRLSRPRPASARAAQEQICLMSRPIEAIAGINV